jgi:hypothetical protein
MLRYSFAVLHAFCCLCALCSADSIPHYLCLGRASVQDLVASCFQGAVLRRLQEDSSQGQGQQRLRQVQQQDSSGRHGSEVAAGKGSGPRGRSSAGGKERSRGERGGMTAHHAKPSTAALYGSGRLGTLGEVGAVIPEIVSITMSGSWNTFISGIIQE